MKKVYRVFLTTLAGQILLIVITIILESTYVYNMYDKSALRSFVRAELYNDNSPYKELFDTDVFYVNTVGSMLAVISNYHNEIDIDPIKKINNLKDYNAYLGLFDVDDKASSYISNYIKFYEITTAKYAISKSYAHDIELDEISEIDFENVNNLLSTRYYRFTGWMYKNTENLILPTVHLIQLSLLLYFIFYVIFNIPRNKVNKKN